MSRTCKTSFSWRARSKSDNRLRELHGCTYTINQRHGNLITDLAGEPSNRSTTDYDDLCIILGDDAETLCKHLFSQIIFRSRDIRHGSGDCTRGDEFAIETMCVRGLHIPGLETRGEAHNGVAIAKHVGGKECGLRDADYGLV